MTVSKKKGVQHGGSDVHARSGLHVSRRLCKAGGPDLKNPPQASWDTWVQKIKVSEGGHGHSKEPMISKDEGIIGKKKS